MLHIEPTSYAIITDHVLSHCGVESCPTPNYNIRGIISPVLPALWRFILRCCYLFLSLAILLLVTRLLFPHIPRASRHSSFFVPPSLNVQRIPELSPLIMVSILVSCFRQHYRPAFASLHIHPIIFTTNSYFEIANTFMIMYQHFLLCSVYSSKFTTHSLDCII